MATIRWIPSLDKVKPFAKAEPSAVQDETGLHLYHVVDLGNGTVVIGKDAGQYGPAEKMLMGEEEVRCVLEPQEK